MAKRVIQECDLTKQEYDPDETVTLVIKKKGKQSGRTYELSQNAATKLEQQLVAGKEAALLEDWQFGGTGRQLLVPTNSNDKQHRTLGDLEAEDDSKFVSDKRAELKEAGVIKAEEREEPAESVVSEALGAPKSNGGCRHLNKGRIQTTLKGSKRFVYRMCADCRTRIPEMTTEERKAFMDGKTDPDVRVRDLTNT